jgi:1-aminocyclopropane-1-carboxylate deaminase/D-cysteine desulfhydrase-like pyridoxal-dependent ACC family enzyme
VGGTDLAGTLPREPLGVWPTPLVRAHRLERALGGGPVLVKRDDLAGFAVGGNKTRPLEFLLGEARARGAEVLVTGGGAGSNFCAAAAVAASVAGLDCELVVWGRTDGPNLDMARACGARVRPTGGSERAEVDRLVAERAAELTAAGRPAYPVPRGGSTPLGAVGFAVAAAELAGQQARLPEAERPSVLVLAVGSGGSCAGLLAGLAAVGLELPVLAVSVSRAPEEIEAKVRGLARDCARLLGTPEPSVPVRFVDARGPGFGAASVTERAHARLGLRTEGLLLDHTYGAEAFSVAVDLVAGGGTGPVLFWHTGGVLPAALALATAPRAAPHTAPTGAPSTAERGNR